MKTSMDTSVDIQEVGIADMKLVSAPTILVTRGLGSCLGIVIYEPYKKIGALAHPMLPRMEDARIKSNPCKFVDSVIPLMVEKLKEKGCIAVNLTAKIFGGAHMFSSIPQNSAFNIGARNIQVAHEVLEAKRLKVKGEDTGDNYGRTIFFDLSTGVVRVKTLFQGEREI